MQNLDSVPQEMSELCSILVTANQRRAIYIAIYRLTTIIGLSGHIVVYMLNSRCKHLVKSHWYLIHAVQAGKIIVVI